MQPLYFDRDRIAMTECVWNGKPGVVCPFGTKCRRAASHKPVESKGTSTSPVVACPLSMGNVSGSQPAGSAGGPKGGESSAVDLKKLPVTRKESTGTDVQQVLQGRIQMCKFCGEAISVKSGRGLMAWHYARYHRFDVESGTYQCWYCNKIIENSDLKTHGLETCVLCQSQFQHYGPLDWGMSDGREWGQMTIWKKQDMDKERWPGDLDLGTVVMRIDLIGLCRGIYYSPHQLPTGPVCSNCIGGDERLLHLWSH